MNSENIINGLIRSFSIAVTGLIVASIVAAAVILISWCFLWTLLLTFSN